MSRIIARSSAVTVGIVVLLAATAASAQEAQPTDNELRTAYCIPIVNQTITVLQQALAKANASEMQIVREGLEQQQANLDRMQLYLLPKMAKLDPLPLAGAASRAQADMLAMQAVVHQCTGKCTSVPAKEAESCTQACTDNPALLARVRQCNDPSWLPF